MIHTKYVTILSYFTNDFTKRMYGRQLVGKVNMSPKNIALTLNELESEGILTSQKQGNLKFFALSLRNPRIKDLLVQTEISKRIDFFTRHPKIEHIFRNDTRIVGIFGSYANRTEKSDSDVDCFIIGKKIHNDYDEKGKLFDLPMHMQYFTTKEFIRLLSQKNNLIKEMVNNHILLFGTEDFIQIVWRYFYGFD
ncbi:nucleotidyltransferase domain-containing protein [Candidatus Woesearchaeota archaeon]|nr:nucleotidyltransferase domain-containing protein [Candidatus Woesearchaeota archaeon]